MTTEGAPTSDPDEIRRVYRRSYRLPAAVEDRLYPPLLLGHDPTAFTPGTSAGGTSDLAKAPVAGESCTMPEPLVTW